MPLNRVFILRHEQQTEAVVTFIRQNASAMALAGTPLAVTVTEAKSKRSLDQNNRYWVLLNDIAANAWVEGKQFSAEAWHEHFKREFIGLVDLPNGQTVGISTTTLTVENFTRYMDQVQEYALDHLAVEFG